MADSVGSVYVEVKPDARGWAEKLRAEIGNLTIDAPVDPDVSPAAEEDLKRKGKRSGDKFAGGFNRSVQTRIRAALKAIPDLNIRADTTDAQLKLDFLRDELKALSDAEIGVDVSTDEAVAKVAELQAQLAELAQSSPEIQVRVDALAASASLAAVQAQVDALDNSNAKVGVNRTGGLTSATSGLEKFASSLGLIPALAVAAGAALIPLTAVVGGLAAALAAPLLFVGGGVGIFAVLGALSVAKTEGQLKAISKLREKLDGLKKGTKEYAAAQKELRAQTAALTPAQKELGEAQGALGSAFSKMLQGRAGSQILGVVSQGMMLLAHILPPLSPVIDAVAGALGELFTQFDRAIRGGGFHDFIEQVSGQIGPDLMFFGGILGDITTGVGDLLLVFGTKLSGDLLDWISTLTSNFAEWASSREGRQGIRDFITYVKDVGPQVGETIGKIARAIGHIVDALAPLSPTVLTIISGVADALSGIPLPILTELATVLLAMTAVNKLGGFKLAGAVGGGVKRGGLAGGVTSLFGGKVQHVWVDNPGFGGPGGPGGTSNEAKAAAAAAAAARGVPTAAEALSAGGRFARFGAKFARFGEFIGAPAFISSNPNTGTVAGPNGTTVPRFGTKVALGPGGTLPTSIPAEKSIRSTSTHVDALRANLAKASRAVDLIGPHADIAFGAASKGVDTFTGKLNAIRDKRFRLIADDAAAIRALERIQAQRIADKNFTIYARYQQAERTVGPGGGMGRPGGGSDGAGAPVNVHVSGHVDENGYVSGTAQDVYNQNRDFETAHR